jgi:hypothetical protein
MASAPDEGVEAVIDFRLAGGGHFVVLALDLDAQLLHHRHISVRISCWVSAGATGK